MKRLINARDAVWAELAQVERALTTLLRKMKTLSAAEEEIVVKLKMKKDREEVRKLLKKVNKLVAGEDFDADAGDVIDAAEMLAHMADDLLE